MKVALDLTLLSIPRAQQAGMARYVRELAHHLPRVMTGASLCGYSLRPQVDLALPGRSLPHLRGRLLAFAEQMPAELLVGWADVVHTPAGAPPRTLRAATVHTFHDLQFMVTPEFYLDWVRRAMTDQARAAAERCRLLICNSDATRRQVNELLGVPLERTVVVPMGIGAEFRPLLPAEISADFRERLPEHYLLHLGLVEERKNLVMLLEAYAEAAARLPTLPQLVLAGNPGHQAEPVLAARRRLGLEGQVILAGHVADSDLPTLYSGATALLYPSLYEGFGMPAIEAMACGCPVLCSDRGALPEVVGDAALVLPADDPAAWAEAIYSLGTAPALGEQLRAAGLARAGQFSWERTARETAAAYRQAAA